MERREPLRRTKGLSPGKPLQRRTGIDRGEAPRRKAAPKRKPARDAAAARQFRQDVLDRAKGRCEVCPVLAGSGDPDAVATAIGCRGRADHAHHLQARGMGGHGDNDPSNGIAACAAGHEFIESNRRLAYSIGLLRRHGRPGKLA